MEHTTSTPTVQRRQEVQQRRQEQQQPQPQPQPQPQQLSLMIPPTLQQKQQQQQQQAGAITSTTTAATTTTANTRVGDDCNEYKDGSGSDIEKETDCADRPSLDKKKKKDHDDDDDDDEEKPLGTVSAKASQQTATTTPDHDEESGNSGSNNNLSQEEPQQEPQGADSDDGNNHSTNSTTTTSNTTNGRTMSAHVFQLGVALLGGIAGGLQSPMAGMLEQRTKSVVTSVLVTYGSGALLAALLALILFVVQQSNSDKTSRISNTENWTSIPWYAYLAGPMGLVVVGTLGYTTQRLGAATSTTVFVLSWLVFASLVDHFGWFDVTTRSLWSSPSRLCGIAALMLGTWLVVREEK